MKQPFLILFAQATEYFFGKTKGIFVGGILFLLGLCCSYTGYAQKSWSLEQCINHAIDNNIQIKQQELLIEQNENTLSQSKYDLIPQLGAELGYAVGRGRALDPTTYQFSDTQFGTGNASISTSVTLFSGMQKRNTIKRNALDFKASIQDVEKLKNDISLNVAAAYLQVLLSQEALAIAVEQVESTKLQVFKAQKMVDAGKQVLGNLLELQAQQAGEEAQVVKAQNEIALSYLSLRQLLELLDESSFEITPIVRIDLPEENTSNDSEAIFTDAVTRLPEIKSAELKVLSAEKSYFIAQGRFYPTLRFNGSYTSSYSTVRERPKMKADGTPVIDSTGSLVYEPYPFWDQWNNNRTSNLGLTLSIPIFTGFQARYGVKNAKLNVRNSELQLQYTKNTLYKEIQQASTDVQAMLNTYHASSKNVEALEESFSYMQKKFDAGTSTLIDYTVSKNNLFKAQSDNIQAKYQYIFKSKILDFYKGLPIKL